MPMILPDVKRDDQGRVLNAAGLPFERQLQWGPICAAQGSVEHGIALQGRLTAMGITVDRTTCDILDPDARLEALEDLADMYLPDLGELFVWRGNYGVYSATISWE